MELVPITEIVTPSNRQRRDFDPIKINELAEKIASVGLLQPIIVRPDGRTLVAGERRLRAIKHLDFLAQSFDCGGSRVPSGHIPVLRTGDLDATALFEAELFENVIREDLNWREKAEAMAKLAELRGMQKGAPVSNAELAEEVHGRSDGYFQDSVRQSLIVAKHLDNPVLDGVKTVKEAVKILKMEEQKQKFKEAGEKLPSEVLKNQHRLLIGDFRMQVLPDNHFSVLITDPPYGIGADKLGISVKTTAGHGYDDTDGKIWEHLMQALALTSFRIAAPNAHIYLFCDLEKFFMLRDLYESVGFRVWKTPFILYRKTSVRAPWNSCGPWKSTEMILYAMKGEKPCNVWRTDVVECRGEENLGHGAQKPSGAYIDLLERSSKPGDPVADLCCGTGTIFAAAHMCKCIATGVELDPTYAAIAAKRLEELK